MISEEKLDKILPQVKAMIVTSSSAALEGIASGCPVIVPMLSSTINMSPLSGVSDLGVYAESPEKLRSLVDDITNRDESPISYDRCKEFIENYFRFPDSNNELIETIEKFSGVFL